MLVWSELHLCPYAATYHLLQTFKCALVILSNMFTKCNAQFGILGMQIGYHTFRCIKTDLWGNLQEISLWAHVQLLNHIILYSQILARLSVRNLPMHTPDSSLARDPGATLMSTCKLVQRLNDCINASLLNGCYLVVIEHIPVNQFVCKPGSDIFSNDQCSEKVIK